MNVWNTLILLLIAWQGHHSYAVREKATTVLLVVAAFTDIRPFILAALRDPDLEIARRSDRVFEIVRHKAVPTRNRRKR